MHALRDLTRLVHFDADCHVPDPTALLDWYVAQLRAGAIAAYSHVGYYDLRSHSSIAARMAAHHLARWVKRNVLRLPTIRGSNYAVSRSVFLDLYERGHLAEDMNVGPSFKRRGGGRVVYSGDPLHVVLRPAGCSGAVGRI